MFLPIVDCCQILRVRNSITPIVHIKMHPAQKFEWKCLFDMAGITEEFLLHTITAYKKPLFTTAEWEAEEKPVTNAMLYEWGMNAIQNAAAVEDVLLLNRPNGLELEGIIETEGVPVTRQKIRTSADLSDWCNRVSTCCKINIPILRFNKDKFLQPSTFPTEMILAYSKNQYVKRIDVIGSQPISVMLTLPEQEDVRNAMTIPLSMYKTMLMNAHTPQMFRDLYPIPASLKEKEHL